MNSRQRLLSLTHVMLVVAILCNLTAPALYAQQTTPLFLPLIANGRPVAQSDLIFRTHIQIQTPVQWRDLQRMEVVILDQGADWATVLVDDLQLEDLARLRYNPDVTNALATMAAHDSTLQAAVADLLQHAAALGKQIQAAEVQGSDVTSTAARVELRAYLQQLETTQLEAISQAASVDSDNDGLTNDQEIWWCTSTQNRDSDFDGTDDGAEVNKLKAWMNHQLAVPPVDTAQPFNGWPFDNSTCIDNDRDSIPNLAERWELGLNMNIESTDRDRYDDGQEVYGTTYCPGSGNACGHGQLPSANHDGILLFPQLPAWVSHPGNHPLVAAFPKVDVDLVPDRNGKVFQVRLATVVTTDERHEEGETKLYSTTKTNGTSTSNAETETWEEWQEVANTNAAIVSSAAGSPRNSTVKITQSTNVQTTNVIQNFTELTVNLSKTAKSIPQVYLAGKATEAADFAISEACAEVHCRRYGSAAVRTAVRAPAAAWDLYQSRTKSNQCESGILGKLKCAWSATTEAVTKTWEEKLDAATREEQEARDQMSGTEYTANNGMMDAQKIYPISYPMPSFVPTITETKGSSRGGAKTTTHTNYEEHSVTQGEEKQFGRSWGTATAQDSTHAADLWFAYEVRNSGTDYARSICNLALNVYISDLSIPATTYYPAADFGGNGCLSNFRPGEAHKYTFPSQSRIALTLDQLKAIDLGEPVRIVVEDLSLGQDDYYTDDAVLYNVSVAIEDGDEDDNEEINTYSIPTWGQESVLQLLARYFPNETDANGAITAIWTPEYRSDNPPWCKEWRRPSDYPSRVLWCKHQLSTAEWWNVYTDGLGDGSEGFQDTQAVPGAVALFRFNRDSDVDSFSDRTERQLGTDPTDATSFPRPEVLAGLHQPNPVNQVITATLSLLNSGRYDAYGMEAVMVAPDDSVTILGNTVGGSGRVRALKQIIVGSRTELQSPLPSDWLNNGYAKPSVAGYYTGNEDRIYTFSVQCTIAAGCDVGSGDWRLNWNDNRGGNGQLQLGAGYLSPNFLPVAHGITLALYSGKVNPSATFTVRALTPRDTFSYRINREPYTEPLVIVSYNDPQGNHRFVLPPAAMKLNAPTDNLQQFAGAMLDNIGVEIVTSQPFTIGVNNTTLLVNNPSDKTLQNAYLFLEVVNISGTVVAETPVTVTLPPGPTATPITFNTGSFNPAYRAADDYIVMAFLTDYQGNILDTAGRPLSSFQVDPLPELAADDATLSWNIGTVTQGTLLKHKLALANTGFGRLYTYIPPTSGLALNTVGSRAIGAADQPLYELTLRTADLPVGAYDQTITLATSDPANPTRSLRVYGAITAASGDTSGGILQRPLDFAVTVPGSHSQGEWVEFTHDLGPEPLQNLHPVKVYSQDYSTLYGVGKYATAFGQGTASYDMFGDGRDGMMPASGNLDYDQGFGVGVVNSGSTGTSSINVSDSHGAWRINPGDTVLIHQTQGNSAGCWEINKSVSDIGRGTDNYQLAKPLRCNYSTSGNNRAQILRVPQYTSCDATGTLTPLFPWNGIVGGIFAVMCNSTMTVSGAIQSSGFGFRGGKGGDESPASRADTGQTGESYTGPVLNGPVASSDCGGCVSPVGPANGGGGYGGRGSRGTDGASGGGGGSYGSLGAAGQREPVSPHVDGGWPGATYGVSDLSTLYLGSGGGGGGKGKDGYGADGSNGGGIIVVYSRDFNVTGSLLSMGGNAPNNGLGNAGGGGGGSGGSIYITSGSVIIGNNKILATGGNGGSGVNHGNGSYGGNGGSGRIYTEYCNTIAGNTTPDMNAQKLTCYITEQVETTPYATARLNLPETFSNGRTYNVQFGHKLDFNASGEQVATLRVPAGLVANSTLDVLVSNAGTGDLLLKLDVGNNGSWDWESTQNVTNAAIFSSPDLSAAFNQYWSSHGSPTTGNIEIPVKLWLSKGATAFVTNLQQLNLTTSGTGSALEPKPLDVTVAITSSHVAGEWAPFTHNLGPESQTLHPVKVYDSGYNTLLGVGQFVVPPATCADVKQRHPNSTDGIYTVNLKNDSSAPFQIYCHDMSNIPKEYLQLVNVGSSLNYSMGASGGWWPGSDVHTRFSRLRLNVDSLLVDRNDLTFAASTGQIIWNNNPLTKFSYAIAATCKFTSEGLASANIDLRGTPFRLDDSVAFQVFGHVPSGNISISGDRQVVNLTGGGACGYTEPSTPLQLKYLGSVTDNSFIVRQISINTTSIRLPENIIGNKVYKVQFGRKLDFATAGNQVTTLRVPAGLYNSVQIDALVSDLPANATLSLDVGNDGSTEWSGAVANNSTNVSGDLAAAFTVYWRSQNSPSGGTLDVPIKVTTSQPGQILLTNLQVSATGSRLRYVRVPVANYTRFLLDFTAGNGGTVALDLGDDGSIDWSTPLAAPRQLTENLNDELNAYLAGKSGNVYVPVRFYLAPLHPITLNDYQATVASTLDLIANNITVGNGVVTAAGADSILINAGSTATVRASLRNNSSSASGPVTAAFFATATGWGDWYIGSAFVANIAATSNVTVTIPWNTTGFSGTVPVKVVINPYQRVAETNYNNNRKETSVIVPLPPVLPAPPTNLVGTMAATNRINLTWTDASTNETGFKIERLPDGINGWTQIATVGAGVTTYASTGLACGKAYFYRVRAYNGNGDSAFSNVATSLTRLCTPALQPLTAITQTQLTLVWSDTNSNESGFKIERSLTGAIPWSQIATVGANVTTYINSGLQCGTPYYYRMRAYNGNNHSAYSAIVNATTTICAPAAPTLLAATAISATQINLSWTDASSNESGFKVERSPDGVNGWTLRTTVGANVTSLADSGLACATTYHYRVRATNAGGDSAASNVANATTPACLPDLIFADSFESGNLLAWSSRAIGGGDLRVNGAAKLVGNWGMEANINDAIAMYVTDDNPNAEPRYRFRFAFDPNALVMANNDAHYLFYGYQGTSTVVLRLEFRRYNGSYQVRAATLNDPPATGAATWRATSYYALSDATNVIEVDWQAATAPGANNGSLTLWRNNVQRATLTALDNDTRRIDRARLGPIGGIDAGTRGSYFFDAFESRRRSYIGPVGGVIAAEVTTPAETLTTTSGIMVATAPLQVGTATVLTAHVAGLGVTVAFPAMTDSEAFTAHLLLTDTQTLPDGYTLVGEMMTVQSNVPLTQPVTVSIAYDALIGTMTPTTTLTLQRWQHGTAQWEVLPAQIDPHTHTITADIDGATILALWQQEEEAMPTESDEAEAPNQAAGQEFSIYLPLVQE